MNEQDALRWARNRAKNKQTDVYVVWSVEEQDVPGEHYHTSSEFDLDAFYNGCEVVAVVQPDGTVSQ